MFTDADSTIEGCTGHNRLMTSSDVPLLRIGTRTSALATAQARLVAGALQSQVPGPLRIELVPIVTAGDRSRAPLSTLGGTGVFVTALRDGLHQNRCDIAVHSLKDLPTGPADGLTMAAIPLRADPRDALCARDGWTMSTLPPGARVGTGSPRRRAQLLATRPDLDVVELRGNVDTRLKRVAAGDLDAVVLAAAGLHRLGRLDTITDYLEAGTMLPAPGQGALAIECRADDLNTRALVAALDDLPTRLAVTAERTLLATLEAGCAAPVGALGSYAADPRSLTLTAAVHGADGTAQLWRGAEAPMTGDREHDLAAAAGLGEAVAQDLLRSGARSLAPPRSTDPAPRGGPPPRVLVPLLADGSQRLISAVGSLGYEPVVAALLRVEPAHDTAALTEAAGRLTHGDQDWLVLTSARAVAALQQTTDDSLSAMQSAGGFRVAAIGPATAGRARAAGLQVDLVPALVRSASGLLAALTTATARDAAGTPPATAIRALLPHSDLASSELADGLRAQGWQVEEVIAYRTVLATSLPPEAQDVQAVVLTSSSAAVAWAGLRPPTAPGGTAPALVCIG